MYIDKENKEIQRIVNEIKKNGRELIELIEKVKNGEIKIKTKAEIIEKYKNYLANDKEYREERLIKNVNLILDEVEKERGAKNGR